MSDKNYKVGYAKPPKETQWKKGESGNPKGRPQNTIGKIDLRAAALKEMHECVPVKSDGETMVIPKYLVMIKSVALKAIKGDMKAVNFFQKLLPQESELIPVPVMIINPPAGCTCKDCPDFDPASIPPPIFGEDEQDEEDEEYDG